MPKFYPEKMTDQELFDFLPGTKVTFTGYISDREDEERIETVFDIGLNDRGRYAKVFTGSKIRVLPVDKITKYTKRK